MKFGLMKYSYTTNLGNEIQSIAARQFLPKIDCFIEHEKLNLFESNEKVKMIMNGWYLDCPESWPPSDDIDPLLISMHFNSSYNNTKEIITKPESRNFFSSHGAVGCRDVSTANLLNNLGIDAYYSGDLTLTLTGKSKLKSDYKYIVVNSHVSKEIINFLKTKTDIPIYSIHQHSIESLDLKYLDRRPVSNIYTSEYDFNEKFFLAENLLRVYENAHCVITDRVHCALPCLAFKTPVLFFNTATFGPERLKGLDKLLHQSNLEEYKANYEIFDVENPPQNQKEYLKIRHDLIKKTKEFTGHFSQNYVHDYSYDFLMAKQMELFSKTTVKTKSYTLKVAKIVDDYESGIR